MALAQMHVHVHTTWCSRAGLGRAQCKRCKQAVLRLSTYLLPWASNSLHLQTPVTEVRSPSVEGSTEWLKMGLEGRDGQNGYLPDASTSSYDVAAMPSDTSYDRDPEARTSVAPHMHSHNSEAADCGITFAGAAVCMHVLALRSPCPDASTNICASFSVAPLSPLCTLLSQSSPVWKVECFAASPVR